MRISVPATSANLGPGFDGLGLALDLRDHLEAEVLDEGLVIEVSGEGAGEVPLDETHLVVASLRQALAVLGVEVPGLRLRCTNVIPHARGLGSSSAAIVGGMALARALVDGGEQRLGDAELLQLAARLEGHPDNVGPAVLGGFVIGGRDADGSFWAVPGRVAAGVRAVALVPPHGLSTEVARGLLPAEVSHADAAANSGRAALLVHALGGAPEHLLRATEDRLHQEQRRAAMVSSLALIDALRAEGRAAVVSGAGPTVLVLLGSADPTTAVLERCPEGWAALDLAISSTGVRREA